MNIPLQNTGAEKPLQPKEPAKASFWQRTKRILWKVLIWFVIISNVWVLAYRWIPVPITYLMIARMIEQKSNGKPAKCEYKWLTWEDISSQMPRAVIISEDQKFLIHAGFDTDALLYAIKRNTNGKKRLVGGSTISQQTAKNVFLFPARNILRKGLEAWFTLLIEIWWPKQRIMQVYLNVIEMGDGIYGCEAASQAYFQHSAATMSKSEAAIIAAVLPNPRKYRVKSAGPFVLKRQAIIMKRMNRLPPLDWN